MEDALSAPCLSIKQYGPSWLEERLGQANGNTKIRTAKTFDYRECHVNYFTIAIDERSAGAAGGGLRIVDNLVRKNVADMSLSNQRTDEFTAEKFVDNLFWLSARSLGNVVHGIFPGARENSANARSIAEGKQRPATDCRLLAPVDFLNGFFQTRQIAL